MGGQCCAASGDDDLRYVPDSKRVVESPEPSVISHTYSSWRAAGPAGNARINTDLAAATDIAGAGRSTPAGYTPDTLHTPKPDPPHGWQSVDSHTPSVGKSPPISPMPTDDETTLSLSFNTASTNSSTSNCLSRLNWTLIASKLRSFQSRLVEPAEKRDKRERWLEEHKCALKKAAESTIPDGSDFDDDSSEMSDYYCSSSVTTTAVWKFVSEVLTAAEEARLIRVNSDSASSLDDMSRTATETMSAMPVISKTSHSESNLEDVSTMKQRSSEFREIEQRLIGALSSLLGWKVGFESDRRIKSSEIVAVWHSGWLASWESIWMSEWTLGMQYAWDCIWCAMFLCLCDRRYCAGSASASAVASSSSSSSSDDSALMIHQSSSTSPSRIQDESIASVKMSSVTAMMVHLDELVSLPHCRLDSDSGFAEVTKHNSVLLLYLSRFLKLCKFPECGKLVLGYHCCLHSPHLTAEVIRELAVNADRDHDCEHPELSRDTRHLLQAAVESIDPDEIDPSMPVTTAMLDSLHASVASLSALFADNGLDSVFGQIFGTMK